MHRYVKGQTTTTAPTHLVCVVADWTPLTSTATAATCQAKVWRLWTTYSRRKDARWVSCSAPIAVSPADWFQWLSERMGAGKRLYVIGSKIADILTGAGFWDCVDSGEYSLYPVEDTVSGRKGKGKGQGKQRHARLVLSSPPDIVVAHTAKGSVTFTSIQNWGWDDDDVARTVDCVTGRPVLSDHPIARGCNPDGAVHAEALQLHCQRAISDHCRDDRGRWADTIGGLALSLWRRRFTGTRVCRHADPRGAALEGDACHGGRASVWYYGDAGDRSAAEQLPTVLPVRADWNLGDMGCHRLDVRSMYPALLRDKAFPVRLMSVTSDFPLGDLRGFLREWGAIARVSLSTHVSEYPYRSKDRLRWPIGQWVTTLAGPELLAALADGAITAVHELARYEMGRPLRGIADYLIRQRAAAREAGDLFAENQYKLMANALGGKFAQRAGRWVPDGKLRPPVMWGEFLEADAESGDVIRCRAVAGAAFRREESRRGNSLLCALYCYLTSYGRCQMRTIREALPTNAVLSQDTDGVWVTTDGLNAAHTQGMLTGDSPGRLRHVESVGYARFLSPRHYVAGTKWVLSGIAVGRTFDASGNVVEHLSVNPVKFGPMCAPDSITHHVRTVSLSGIHPDTPVNAATGWAHPWLVSPGVLPWELESISGESLIPML